MWHVSSGSGVATLRSAIHLLLTYIHTDKHLMNSQAEGSNLRCGWSLGGKRTVDINDKQTDEFLDEI